MDELVFHELVWEIFASFKFSSVACRYDPDFEGISFSLRGEPRKMSLLEFRWRVRLYSEEQSRLSSTMNGLCRRETVKDEHVLMQFWPYIGDDDFVVREDEEVEEAANEEAGGSAEVYQNMSRGDWKIRQARRMDQQDELRHFQYLSTHDNLDPHLQIDPFPRHEADYPLYGYTGRMPPGYEYQFGPAPPGGFDKNTLFSELSFLFFAAAYFALDFSLSKVPLSFLITFSIMAKKDMDLYHSRLTQDDLNDLIIKYKIPHDLHPWLPSEEFVMFELLNDAIGINNRMFDFSSVRIPFSSFLLALIKHYKLKPTVNLFRVFKTLYKQGDWFSFAKHRAPSLVSIDDPRPAAGSFNMADVCRLSAHVVKLRDMPEDGTDGNVLGIHDFLCLPEWTGAEVQVEPHLDVRLTLQRLPFYCTPPAATDAVIPKPALEDLAIGDSDDESDGDDDTCIEIPLVTPLRSAAVIHPSGNQGRSSAAPAAEGSNTRDSWGKGIMVDDTATPPGGVSRPRLSIGPAPSFRDVSGGAIHTDFFPFSTCPYYATYPKDGVAGNYEFTREEWDAPY
ncbi:hypothetical protein Tco_0260897 [Tanacetum coccineum]